MTRRLKPSVNDSYIWKETPKTSSLPGMGPETVQLELPLFTDRPSLHLLPKPTETQVVDDLDGLDEGDPF